jgi:cytochrome b pre-mRNA-processing protein 3
MLKILRKSRAERACAERLAAAIIERARAPVFFETLKVPDTLDGRFDLVALHAWMVLERLGQLGRRDLAQMLTDVVFTGFDEGLRELGAGDVGMGRRMKKMATAFYGRLGAYREAQGGTAMAAAILRNVYRGADDRSEQARSLARYVETAMGRLAGWDPSAQLVDFGDVPPN